MSIIRCIISIKAKYKERYKREVRRLVRRQKHLLQKKLAKSFSKKNRDTFWADAKRINSTSNSIAPIVDNVHDCGDIANVFASKYKTILNTHSLGSHLSLNSTLHSSLTEEDMCNTEFSGDDVFEAILQLKRGKADDEGVFSEHLIFASPALTEPLANFFTSLLRHGYMPQNLRDCVLIPIPKKNKDPSSSLNYRPISLASSLSKILERMILIKYAPFLSSSSLEFGFKAGSSTTLCTGVVKSIISNYIHNGSSVLGCFLDASKAFDLVNHDILFQKLYDRGLPQTVMRFLSSWYITQQMSIRWGSSFSHSFNVSNGVRQGSVLLPVLFSVYLDGLLEELARSGVGCHCGCVFAGAICYADDIVLLAPCPSSLRIMLQICDKYAQNHGLSLILMLIKLSSSVFELIRHVHALPI